MTPEPGEDGLPIAAIVARAFGCKDELAGIIAARARLRDHPARTTILHGEQPAEQLHLMIEGHARMIATALEGRTAVIEDYRPGDLFGERGLFDPLALPHDVVAVRASRTGAFVSAEFVGLMGRYAAVALAVSRLLVARLNLAQRRHAEGTTLSVRGRVCAELLRLAHGAPDLTITPAPVLAQLALAVDSTRESVSRAISLLERRGLIRRTDQALTVIAPHRLEELVY